MKYDILKRNIYSTVPNTPTKPEILPAKLYTRQRMIIAVIIIMSGLTVLLFAALIATSTYLISSNNILASQLKHEFIMLKKGLKCLSDENTTSSVPAISRQEGMTPSVPATSCHALSRLFPSSYYWVASSNHSAIRVYCDMTRTCGSITGGWMRVVSIDMNQTSSECPVVFTVLSILSPQSLYSKHSLLGPHSLAMKWHGSRTCGGSTVNGQGGGDWYSLSVSSSLSLSSSCSSVKTSSFEEHDEEISHEKLSTLPSTSSEL